MSKFKQEEFLKQIREKAAEKTYEEKYKNEGIVKRTKGWPDAVNKLKTETDPESSDDYWFSKLTYEKELIVTFTIKREESKGYSDEEWSQIRANFANIRDILKDWIIAKKTGYGLERLRQLENQCLKYGAVRGKYGTLVWKDVVIRFSELHRTKKGAVKDGFSFYMPDFISSRLGKEVLGEKWGRKEHLNPVPRSDTEAWYGLIKYKKERLVRISVKRNGLEPTNPEWRRKERAAEKVMNDILAMMKKPSNIYGEEWLKDIEKQCIAAGAAKVQNNHLSWDDIMVYFKGLYH